MIFISGLLAGVWIGFFIFACVDISREADKNESLFLLENKLVQIKNNLKTLSKAFQYWIPDLDNLNVDGWFHPLEVNFHNQPMLCFTGDFTTNFLIPEFLGLGKQSARGFGVVRKKEEKV